MTAPRLTELALFTADVSDVTAFYERVLGIAPAEQSDRHAIFALGELVWTTPPRWPRRASRSTGRATFHGAAPPTYAIPTAASSS